MVLLFSFLFSLNLFSSVRRTRWAFAAGCVLCRWVGSLFFFRYKNGDWFMTFNANFLLVIYLSLSFCLDLSPSPLVGFPLVMVGWDTRIQ